MTLLAGLDFGGTSVKLGLVDGGTGAVLARGAVPVRRDMSFAELAGAVEQALEGFPAGKPAAIGIASPGYADPETGVLIDGTNNIPALGEGQSLTARFAARYRVPVTIDNDGTCAALGELAFGCARGLRRFVLMTLGTGIGGGVVIDGRPVLGSRRTPPEIGAVCLDPDGPVNYSGVPGSFERLACAASVVERYRAAGGGTASTSAEVFALVDRDDPAAVAAVDGIARAIAQACGIMTNLLNLEACILGGGMSGAGPMLARRVESHLERYTWPLLRRNVEIRLAALGNDAGLLGAAAIAGRAAGLLPS